MYSIVCTIVPKMLIEILYIENERLDIFIKYLLLSLILLCMFGYIKTISLHLSNSKIIRIKNYYSELLCRKIIRLKYQYLEDADFMNRNNLAFSVVEDYDKGIEGVCHVLFEVPSKLILVTIFVCILGKLNFLLVLTVIIDGGFKIVIYNTFSKKMYDKRQNIGESKRRMNYCYKVSNDFSYGKDIRIFDLRALIIKNYVNEISKYIASLKKVYKLKMNLENICVISGIACDIIAYYFLVSYVLDYKIGVSDFVMYITILEMFKSLLVKTNEDISKLICELPYINDFFAVTNKSELYEQEEAGLCKENIGLDIKMSNICFKYPNTDKLILDHINIDIGKGEKVAIVGANGAGKSTLIKLMLGLYSPTSGDLMIGDTNIRELCTSYLRSLYSVVFQDICVYPASIKNNIVCGEKNIDKDKLEYSLAMAELEKVIERLPNGIESRLVRCFYPDGIDLSGGEKQRLAFARAIYRDTPFEILDEPTSALDAFSEKKLYEDIANVMTDKTVIFVSHRLSSVIFCDKILFMENGKVVECGNFNELMELKGFFYKMYSAQVKYYES